ncbi:hypothetical protein [Sphingomonas paucimobilis]|uniref:hypothetical protein n=1 Tax=Sphingomonas paucimobilis TaxID=13689 RepID=UPI0031D43857
MIPYIFGGRSPVPPPAKTSPNLRKLLDSLAPSFDVTPRRDDFLVTWRQPKERDQEIRLWFKERGHQARFIDGQRSKGRYVKCSKAIALLAKLTWGGEV